MKRLILALCMLLALPLAASAQQLKAAPAPAAGQVDELKAVWGGGNPSGSVYSKDYVPQIIKVLETKRLSGYRWGGVSQGTLQNAELVTLHPTNVAVVQYDIGRQLNGQDIPGQPGKKYKFTILHEDIGPECLYVVTKEKNYKTFGHIRANNFDLTVITGGPKSGSFGTWQILQSVFPDLKDIPVEHSGDAKAIVKAVKESDQPKFGFFVMRPDPASEVFTEIASAKLGLVPVIEDELKSTYTVRDLKVESGGLFDLFGKSNTGKIHSTSCTSVALITGDPESLKGAGPDQQREVARLKATIARMKEVPASELRPNLETWRDMWDGMKETGAEKAAELARQSREALSEILKKENR